MTTSTSKPKPTTDQDQPYYIHFIMTLKVRFVVNLEKSLEHRVPENGFAFADYVQFAYEKECPSAPAIISCVPLRSSKRPAVCPVPNPFLGARKIRWGCCITAAFSRSLPSPECEEEKKEQKSRSPSRRLQNLWNLRS